MKKLITAIAICFTLLNTVQADSYNRHSGYNSGHNSGHNSSYGSSYAKKHFNRQHDSHYAKHRPHKVKRSFKKKHGYYNRHNKYYLSRHDRHYRHHYDDDYYGLVIGSGILGYVLGSY
jgi:hypothetical protein